MSNRDKSGKQIEAPPAQDTELLSDFVVECGEHLSTVENHALALERDPDNRESIHSIFRAFHTIKGLAGFLELEAVHEVSHEMETVLDAARNGELRITAGIIDVVLEGADFLKEQIEHLEGVLQGRASQPEPPNRSLLEHIQCILTGGEGFAGGADLSRLARAVERGPASEALRASDETRTVKVDTAKLDYLVDMAGEMVVAQSLVRHDPNLAALNNRRLARNLAQLGRISAEIQKTSMALRLVPIAPLFHRMARLVRDLSRKSGKQVELEVIGGETELDRTIVEQLAAPLMHMVRNAVDHGVEPAETRAAAGKEPAARIRLKACRQAGHVVIEIRDDGRGLDRKKILNKAVQKGLVTNPERLDELGILNLILEPGFSTAEQVTDLSGRGVGMDVVRRQMQRLRGRIEVQSEKGFGATFTLKLPLTLAIIDGLVVGVGAERYIIPLHVVRETFRPLGDAVSSIRGRDETVTLHGTLWPMIRLSKRLGIQARTDDPCRGVLIALESDRNRFCLMVDELIGKQEVVIKNLGETFKNVPGITGGAILGDGRVGLILEVDSIFKGGRDD